MQEAKGFMKKKVVIQAIQRKAITKWLLPQMFIKLKFKQDRELSQLRVLFTKIHDQQVKPNSQQILK
jgi:hypothetical protein